MFHFAAFVLSNFLLACGRKLRTGGPPARINKRLNSPWPSEFELLFGKLLARGRGAFEVHASGELAISPLRGMQMRRQDAGGGRLAPARQELETGGNCRAKGTKEEERKWNGME